MFQTKPSSGGRPEPEETGNRKQPEPYIDLPVEPAPHVHRYPEPPPDFEFDVSGNDSIPASELGEIIQETMPSDSLPEMKDDGETKAEKLRVKNDQTDNNEDDSSTSEPDAAEPDDRRTDDEEIKTDRPDVDREGRVLPPRGKSLPSDDFKLLSVQPFVQEKVIKPVPGDQRLLSMKIFCAENVYRNMAAHAEKGVRMSPEGAMEVKGALLGAVLIDAYPILFIADTLEFPSSPDDRNDQCSFGAVEDELIRRKLAELPQGLNVVGYYHSHPDHPVFFSDFDVSMHNRRCNTPWKIGAVVQPRERIIGFFIKQTVNGRSLNTFIHAQKPDIVVAYDENGRPVEDSPNRISSQPPGMSTSENTRWNESSVEAHIPAHQHSTLPITASQRSSNASERKKSSGSKWIPIWIILFSIICCSGAIVWMWHSAETQGENVLQRPPPASAHTPSLPDDSEKKVISLVERTPTSETRIDKAVLAFTVNVPSAEITIDGNKLIQGTTSLELVPGEHRVQITAKGYKTIEETLTFTAGETLTRSFSLKKQNR